MWQVVSDIAEASVSGSPVARHPTGHVLPAGSPIDGRTGQAKLTSRIEPLDGSAPLEARKTSTVSRVAVPPVGDRYPVWLDAADHETWMDATVADENGRRQIRSLFGAAAETMTGIGDPAAAPATATPAGDPLDRLQKLNELRAAGALSHAEILSRVSRRAG